MKLPKIKKTGADENATTESRDEGLIQSPFLS